MIESDVQLIHRILSGDDEAFSILVQKYQKSVHALVWRRLAISILLRRLRRTPFSEYTKALQH